MTKNKRFMGYTVIFCILGILLNFMYSGLQNDHINIIQAFSAWTNTYTLMPITVGNIVCIVLTYVYGTLFIKFGFKKTLIPCLCLSALGCVGIALANGLAAVNGVAINSVVPGTGEIAGSYALYAISLFVIRCTCMCFQLSSFQLCANWFIKNRGKVMGIITLGSPLFSVVGTSVMSNFITNYLGGDYRPFYIGICVVLVLIAVMVGLFIHDTPEEVGLHPDGLDHAPKSEENVSETHLTIRQVLSQKKSWYLVISYSIFQYIIMGCMASMVSWFTYLATTNVEAISNGVLAETFTAMGGLEGQGSLVLWTSQVTTWLGVGALLGIPMSFLFGLLDDKIGSVRASMLLGATEILAVVGLMYQYFAVKNTGACSVPMLIIWGIGVACMTGGVATLHPCITAFAFGRREYQSANRVIMSIQMIPIAFAASITSYFINQGYGVQYWAVMIVLIVIGIISLIPMLKMKDANAADRA